MSVKYNKKLYKEYKRMAKECNVKFFTEELDENPFNTYNGVSFAYTPTLDSTNCRMLEVAVSYCAPEDTFKPKHGKFQALHKFFAAGETIQLPLAEYYKDMGENTLNEFLTTMFSV